MDMNGVIDEIYATLDTGEWRRPLDLLAQSFSSESSALILIDTITGLPDMLAVTGCNADDGVRRSYQQDYGALDPAPGLFATLAPGAVLTTSKAWSFERRAADVFYNEFYSPLGLRDTIASPIRLNATTIAAISLQRGATFDDEEIKRFGRLMPHVQRALQLHERMSSARAQAITLGDLAAARGEGLLILDGAGRIHFANPVAAAVLSRGDGLAYSHATGLMALNAGADQRLSDILAGRLLPADLTVPRADATGPYKLMLSPVPVGQQSGVAIIILDPEHPSAAEQEFARRHSLTEAETRLLRALLNGERLTGYCRRLGISPNTGKFHMASIFSKTGAHSQIELVRMARG